MKLGFGSLLNGSRIWMCVFAAVHTFNHLSGDLWTFIFVSTRLAFLFVCFQYLLSHLKLEIKKRRRLDKFPSLKPLKYSTRLHKTTSPSLDSCWRQISGVSSNFVAQPLWSLRWVLSWLWPCPLLEKKVETFDIFLATPLYYFSFELPTYPLRMHPPKKTSFVLKKKCQESKRRNVVAKCIYQNPLYGGIYKCIVITFVSC